MRMHGSVLAAGEFELVEAQIVLTDQPGGQMTRRFSQSHWIEFAVDQLCALFWLFLESIPENTLDCYDDFVRPHTSNNTSMD